MKHVWILVKEYIKDNRIRAVLLLSMIILTSILTIVPATILAKIIDQNLSVKNSANLINNIMLYLGATVLIGLLDFFKNFILVDLGESIILNLRYKLINKLYRLPFNKYQKLNDGETLSIFNADINNINTLFSEGLFSLIIDLFKIVIIIGYILTYSFPLALLAIGSIPLILVYMNYTKKQLFKAQSDNLTELSNVSNRLKETLDNFLVIKTFHKESYFEETYAGYLEENFKTKSKVNFIDSFYGPTTMIIRITLISILILLIASGNVAGLSIGFAVMSIELFSKLLEPLQTLSVEIQNIQKGISGIEKISMFLNQEELIQKDYSLTNDPTLKINSLYFSYDKPILKDLNLDIRKGDFITFIGPTGVGKTTLFNLITGLLDPQSGSVKFLGVDTNKLDNYDKSHIYAYVFQEFEYVRGNIYDQVSIFRGYSLEEVRTVMKLCNLDEYIMGLSNGYKTMITGKEFSFGQTQLLGLARAIICKPKILLLDEFSSNIDSNTEQNMLDVIDQIQDETIVLSISHRLQKHKVFDLELNKFVV